MTPTPANPNSGSPTDPTRPSPQPRCASTVVVARPADGPHPEIYMLVRSAKSPFMPSTLVFPGGQLDPGDGPMQDDRSWENAGRRECLEESNLRVSGSLAWFDTWLTPSAEPRRRYLARFFIARLATGQGDDAQADGHETHDGRWATATEHLTSWERGEVDLPPPTLLTLLGLRDRGLAAFEHLDPEACRQPILPKFVLQDAKALIFMPHDPEYPQIIGEGLPAPERAKQLPQRFVRDGRVWRLWTPND